MKGNVYLCRQLKDSIEYRSTLTVSPLALRRLFGEQTHTYSGFLFTAQSASGGLSGLKGIVYMCKQIIDKKDFRSSRIVSALTLRRLCGERKAAQPASGGQCGERSQAQTHTHSALSWASK